MTFYIKTTKGDIMNQLKRPENSYQSRTRTNVIRIFRWTGAWGAATALMAFGPKFLWNKSLVFTLLAVGLALAVGVGMILANKNYLEELDDLQRKVQLNSMGITLGVGLIAGVPILVMESYHIIPFQADIAYLLILMSVTFAVSNLYGTWRYR
jgi:hypothetical protein